MRCEQCGEREATASLTSVVAGALTQEHLCEACMDDRFPAPPTFDDRPLATAFRSRGRPPRLLVQPGERPTLWRGARLLGVIDIVTPPLEGWLVGLLLPDDGHPPLANIDQGRAWWRNRALVVQSELAADAIPWPDGQRSDDGAPPGFVTLSVPFSRPVHAPPERQLQLRDDEGRELPASSITLMELRLVDGLTNPFRARAPAEAVHRTCASGAADRERLWYVLVNFDGSHHAP